MLTDHFEIRFTFLSRRTIETCSKCGTKWLSTYSRRCRPCYKDLQEAIRLSLENPDKLRREYLPTLRATSKGFRIGRFACGEGLQFRDKETKEVFFQDFEARWWKNGVSLIYGTKK